MWEIAKRIDFCYGHRVWSQVLDREYSVNDACACRHLHGHQGHLHIHLKGESLEGGMVTDFKHTNWLKKFVDQYLDHRMIIDINDPSFDFITNVDKKHLEEVYAHTSNKVIKTKEPVLKVFRLDNKNIKNYTYPQLEVIDGFTVVDFIPTSENLAKWIYEFSSEIMSHINVEVSKVTLFETPKSQATFSS